jgi:hypothetical protein
MPVKRYALVNGLNATPEAVGRYLPRNSKVLGTTSHGVVIRGADEAARPASASRWPSLCPGRDRSGGCAGRCDRRRLAEVRCARRCGDEWETEAAKVPLLQPAFACHPVAETDYPSRDDVWHRSVFSHLPPSSGPSPLSPAPPRCRPAHLRGAQQATHQGAQAHARRAIEAQGNPGRRRAGGTRTAPQLHTPCPFPPGYSRGEGQDPPAREPSQPGTPGCRSFRVRLAAPLAHPCRPPCPPSPPARPPQARRPHGRYSTPAEA